MIYLNSLYRYMRLNFLFSFILIASVYSEITAKGNL